MGLKLEVGKFYKTRDGRKVGPLLTWGDKQWHWAGSRNSCNADGIMDGGPSDEDLIAEWTDAPNSPVRTVTRTTREIVPGVYGMVKVTTCPSSPLGVVGINLTSDGWWTAADIRAAIATLTEIAQALEDN